MRKKLPLFLTAAALVVVDQITKVLTRAFIPLGETLTLVPHVVGLTYVQNTGAAFSSFSGGTKLLALLSLVITALIGIAIAKDWLRHPFAQWSMAVVMAGAFGNFIDRAFIGYVTDMVDTLFMNFAVYNFADICVVLGILALAIREVLPVNELGHPVISLRYNLPFLYDILGSLSKVATPLALVALGGQFSFGAVKSLRREIITTTLGRLVAAPAIGFTLAYTASRMGFFAWEPALVAAFIAVFASPVSVSSAPMASEMNADDVLAGQLVVWTSLMGTVSLFVLIVLFQALSWL